MRRSFLFTVLISFIAIFAISCNDDNDGSDKEVIKIGAILPLTGSSSDAANQIKEGIELAKQDIELKYPNLEIEIEYGDSKNSGKDGIAVYNKMKTMSKINNFIVSNSGVVVPLAEIVKDDTSSLVMTTVNSAYGVPQLGNNIFRVFVSVVNEVNTMGEFIIDSLECNNISLLYINDDFGLSGYEEFIDFIEENNMNLIWNSSFPKDGEDFKNIIAKLPKETDLVYVIGYETSFGLIIKQLREYNYNGQIATTIGLSVKPWRDIAGNAAEGAYYTSSNFSVVKPTEENLKFIENFENKYSKQPTSFNAFGYDAASVLFSSLIENKNDLKATQNYIINTTFNGSMGEISFDKDGEANLPLSIYQFLNGVENKIR